MNDRFLAIQSTTFRAHGTSALPDLEAQVLEPLLSRSMTDLEQAADEITVLLNTPRVTGMLDPMLLLDLLAESISEHDDASSDDEEGGITDIAPIGDRFDPGLQEHLITWARNVLAASGAMTFSEVLERAAKVGLAHDERLCPAYLVIGAFHPRDDLLLEPRNG